MLILGLTTLPTVIGRSFTITLPFDLIFLPYFYREPIFLSKQDVFKDEAALSDGGGASQDPEQEWPSDDSEDDDYDPEKNENSSSNGIAGSEADATDDASSSSSLWSLEDEVFSESGSPGKGRWNASFKASIGADCAETTDHEILSGPRERRAVDYTKLYHVSI